MNIDTYKINYIKLPINLHFFIIYIALIILYHIYYYFNL